MKKLMLLVALLPCMAMAEPQLYNIQLLDKNTEMTKFSAQFNVDDNVPFPLTYTSEIPYKKSCQEEGLLSLGLGVSIKKELDSDNKTIEINNTELKSLKTTKSKNCQIQTPEIITEKMKYSFNSTDFISKFDLNDKYQLIITKK